MTLQSVSSSEFCSVDLDAIFSWCSPTPMALIIFMPLLLSGSLTGSGKQDFMETPLLGLCVPRTHSLSVCNV